MIRLLFEKRGNAVWISHLDLMRVFQRAFKRAGLPLTHTQGFNPRPSVSIALPLSVGIESACELLDFDLDGEEIPCDVIRSKLNAALITGVRVLDVYREFSKIKNIAFLDCVLSMEYDYGIPGNAEEAISELFSSSEVVVSKKSKNGITDQNIIPMIRRFSLSRSDGNSLKIAARICCQNPTLNPTQMYHAILKYLPEYAPDHVVCSREEVYDFNENVFR